MAKLKLSVRTASFLLLLALGCSAASAQPLPDRIRAQAQAYEAGEHDSHITLHGGRPAFQLQPSNGYPGTETALSIAGYYEIFERGERRELAIHRAVIDWGDGSSPSVVPGGHTARHTYGTHGEGPTDNRDYLGRITLHLDGGDVVTEQFRYVLWTDRSASVRRGGRVLPGEELESVWCESGTIQGELCVQDFEITQQVHAFEGCFDRNFVEFPVADAPEATFDVRDTAEIAPFCVDLGWCDPAIGVQCPGIVCLWDAYDDGWHVDGDVNQIADLYSGHYRVLDALGGDNNMSGIYYSFTPITLPRADNSPGMAHSHSTFDSATIAIRRADRSYTNRPFSWAVVTPPTASNDWVVRLRIDDEGNDSQVPPCPAGATINNLGWIDLEVEATVRGRVFSTRTTDTKLPSGYFDQEEYRVD